MQEQISKYFPLLSDIQKEKLSALRQVYEKWNSMINVISRKDMNNFFVHHVLHSLSIGKIIPFTPGVNILDVGTGGGFPGIPLAIMFPDSQFTLLDSIGKKIKVVTAVAEELEIGNIIPANSRIEDEKGKYNFVISRAVTDFRNLVTLTRKNVRRSESDVFLNGIVSLKGGDLAEELKDYQSAVKIWNISDFYEEPFFETKKLVFLPF